MKNVSHDYNWSTLYQKMHSFADKVVDVSLVHLVPLALILNAWCSSLDSLSGCLAKNLVSLNDWEQKQRLQCVARCRDGDCLCGHLAFVGAIINT